MSSILATRGAMVVAFIALTAPHAAAAPADLVLSVEQAPWQQVSRERQVILHCEREQYTRLDTAGRFIVAVEMGAEAPPLAELSVAWRIEQGEQVVASGADPIAEGLLAVNFDPRVLALGRYDITAELRHEEKVLATRETFFTYEQCDRPPRSGRVGIVLPRGVDPGAAKRAPITTGVPFPKGGLLPDSPIRLVTADGREIPVQTTVRSSWAPGEEASIRWLGVDFQAEKTDAYWPGRNTPAYFLEYAEPGSDAFAKRSTPEHPVRVEQVAEGYRVDTGPLQFLVRKDGFNLLDQVTLNGQQVIADAAGHGPYLIDHEGAVYRAANDGNVELTIEESGPLRTVIRAAGWYVKDGSDGSLQSYTLPTDKLCKFITRIEAYAGQPSVRVLHTWIITFDPHTVRLRDVGISLPAAASQVQFGVKEGQPITQPVGDDGVYLLQYQPDKFDVATGAGKVLAGGRRSDGSAVVTTNAGSTVLALRDAWERFPKEIEVTPDALRLHVWPAHGRELDPSIDPLARQQIHRMWFAQSGKEMNLAMPWSYYLASAQIADSPSAGIYHPAGMAMAGVHSSAMGAAITTDFLISFAEPDRREPAIAAAASFDDHPHALPEPAWLCASGALGPVHPYDPERFANIEQAIAATLRGYQGIQDEGKEFGMWIYRAWHHNKYLGDGSFDLYRLYNATHHYEAYMPWLMYARSGDPFYLDQGSANIRLLTDVQVLHHEDPSYQHQEFHFGQRRLLGSTKHTNGFIPWGGDHGVLAHLTCYNGMLLAHYLTGDLRLREVVVDEWQQTILADRDNPEYHRANRSDRLGRDNNNALGELIDLYQLTYDPRLLAHIGPATDRFVENMYIWGLPLQNVLEFSGDSRVRKQLLEACRAATGPNRASGATRGKAHTVFKGHSYAGVYAMAAIESSDESFLADAFFRLDPAGLASWAQQFQPGQPSTALFQAPDTLVYLPRIMHALASLGQDIDFAKIKRPQPLPVGALMVNYSSAILRETEDQEIEIRLMGSIGPDGLEVQVFGPDNTLIHRETAAPGDALPPLVVRLPADGKTGQYTVFLMARDTDDRLLVPLTDLPGEVYPRAYWAQAGTTRFFTRSTNAEQGQLAIKPHHGDGQIQSRDFKRLLDSTTSGEELVVTPPEEGVWVEMVSRYVHLRGHAPIVLSLTPDRWFQPDADKLDLEPAP